MFLWDEKTTEVAVKLWHEGKSASIIANELGGGATRHSVIGKIHRMGLQRTPSQRSAMRGSATHRLQRKTVIDKGGAGSKPFNFAKLTREQAKQKQIDADAALEAMRKAADLEPKMRFADVSDHGQCKWIRADSTADAMCCGRPALPGKSWCEFHMARVFVTVPVASLLAAAERELEAA